LRPEPDLRKPTKVLLVRLSAIGDVVHTLPVAAAIKRSFPETHLTWAVEDRCAEVVACNPYVDEIIAVPRHRWRKRRWKMSTWVEGIEFFRDLRKHRFDLALDIQGLMKSAVIAGLSGAPVRLGYHWQREGARLFVRPVPKVPEHKHVVQQYLDVARYLGAVAEPIEFGLRVPAESQEVARALLDSVGITDRYLVVNPSAGKDVKRLPTETLAEMVDRSEDAQTPVVLVGHTNDIALGEAVTAHARHQIRNLIGKTRLTELAAVLESATAHLSGDTGSAHIAAALGVPVVSVYGPTDPARSGPFGQEAGVISRYGLADDSLASITADQIWDKLAPHIATVGSRV